jgi:hypothetical protein
MMQLLFVGCRDLIAAPGGNVEFFVNLDAALQTESKQAIVPVVEFLRAIDGCV